MTSGLQQLLDRRCRRAIAVILSVKERECDRYLPDEAKTLLRKVILDQLNDFADVAADVLESLSQDDIVLNDLWLQKIDEIHALMVGDG